MIQGQSVTGSGTSFDGDMVDSMELDESAFPARFADRTAGVLDVNTRDGSRTGTTFRANASVSNAGLVAEGPFGKKKRGSWLAVVRKSYLQYILARTFPDNTFIFGLEDVQTRLTYDLTSKSTVTLYFLESFSNLNRPGVTGLGVNSIVTAGYHYTFANLGWRYSPIDRLLVVSHAAWMREKFDDHNPENLPTGRRLLWRVGLEHQRHLDVEFQEPAGGRLVAPADPRRGLREPVRERDHRAPGAEPFQRRCAALRRLPATILDGVGRAPALHRRGALGPSLYRRGFGRLPFRLRRAQRHAFHHLPIGVGPVRAISRARDARFPAGQPSLCRPVPTTPSPPWSSVSASAPASAPNSTTAPTATCPFSRSSTRALSTARSSLRRSTRRITTPCADMPAARRFSSSAPAPTASPAGSPMPSAAPACAKASPIGTFPADLDQRHTMNVYGRYRLRPSVNLSLQLELRQRFPDSRISATERNLYYLSVSRNQLRLSPYSRTDFRVNKAWTHDKWKLTLFGEVLNLTDRTNYVFESFNGYTASTKQAYITLDKMFPILPSAGLVFER